MLEPQAQRMIDEVFSYHLPDATQIAACEEIRAKAKELATVIMTHCPNCSDRSTALYNLRASVMWANAAIALQGAV